MLNEVMQQMNTSNYITMGDAARLLGVTKARISQLAASGTLACDIVGGRKWLSTIPRLVIKRSVSVGAVPQLT